MTMEPTLHIKARIINGREVRDRAAERAVNAAIKLLNTTVMMNWWKDYLRVNGPPCLSAHQWTEDDEQMTTVTQTGSRVITFILKYRCSTKLERVPLDQGYIFPLVRVVVGNGDAPEQGAQRAQLTVSPMVLEVEGMSRADAFVYQQLDQVFAALLDVDLILWWRTHLQQARHVAVGSNCEIELLRIPGEGDDADFHYFSGARRVRYSLVFKYTDPLIFVNNHDVPEPATIIRQSRTRGRGVLANPFE